MPRIKRVDVGGEVYHVLNRANARVQIFDNKKDYQQFEEILEEAIEKYEVPLLAYCVMPNHWHMVLQPKQDGDMQKFIGWLSNTHTRRWHVTKDTIGQGHLYQGRYKSFICEQDHHLLTVLRYVERNAKKANLVKKAEDWQWSSVWRRENGTLEQKKILSNWPISIPRDYLNLLNKPMNESEEEALEKSEERSIPFGEEEWVNRKVKKYEIEQVLRGVGRPKNGG
ncbi:MAG: transposase [Candidatus Nomurabacteria bacterium]|nr:MAG: transposase [Candidatus Nomurabacteria bacterium]